VHERSRNPAIAAIKKEPYLATALASSAPLIRARPSTRRISRAAMPAALLALALVAPSVAEGRGALRVSHRQVVRSCTYASHHGSALQRRAYARACRRDAAVISALAEAAQSSEPATYTNPVYGDTFYADPMGLSTGVDYYAYGTGSLFPILHSTDLVSWTSVGTAFSTKPSWVVSSGDSHPWAPSVVRTPSRCPHTKSPACYVMYYVGLHGSLSPTTNCIGVATSTTPTGPFKDLGPLSAGKRSLDRSGRPPGCGDDAGYSNIDPAPFVDSDGRPYLYLSTDRICDQPAPGVACPLKPTISVIPLTSDFLHPAGPRRALFGGVAGTWEQQAGGTPKVEGPWVERRGSTYYLFYSGGDYRAAYGMGYATAASPLGTDGFVKSSANPILSETPDVLSPGGGSVIRGPHGGDWMLYHGRPGAYTEPRDLRIDPVVWNTDGTVAINGPTSTPQSPVP
jgi:beta-xylosidase